jgi:hypothetical protein
VALYCADAEIPSESSGCVVHIHYISHVLHIITVFVMCRPLRSIACYAFIDEKLTGDDYAPLHARDDGAKMLHGRGSALPPVNHKKNIEASIQTNCMRTLTVLNCMNSREIYE